MSDPQSWFLLEAYTLLELMTSREIGNLLVRLGSGLHSATHHNPRHDMIAAIRRVDKEPEQQSQKFVCFVDVNWIVVLLNLLQ